MYWRSEIYDVQNAARGSLKQTRGNQGTGERIAHPSIPGLDAGTPFDPINNPYDLIPSLLICQKLDFSLANIENEIDGLYDLSVQHRHKHNMILSIDDGLLSYYDKNGKNLPYTRLGGTDLKHRFTYPGTNNYLHHNLFGSYVFMLTANKTHLYPEFSDYIVGLSGGFKRDQA